MVSARRIGSDCALVSSQNTRVYGSADDLQSEVIAARSRSQPWSESRPLLVTVARLAVGGSRGEDGRRFERCSPWARFRDPS